MAFRIVFTLLSLLLAAGAFCGVGSDPAGVNLFGVLFLFVAVIVWFDWTTIREGYASLGQSGEDGERQRLGLMMVRLGPLLPLLLKPSERGKPRGE